MTFASALRLMGKKPAGGGSLSLSYLGSDGSAHGSTTSQTYSSVSLGAADADRWIIAYISHSYSNETPTVTIGGVTATIDVEQNSSQEGVFLCRAHVPSGTTGDVVMSTASDDFSDSAYALWRVIGEPSLLDSDTVLAVAADAAGTVNTSASGFVVAGACGQTEQNSIAWTNVTERFDFNTTANAGRKSGGDASGTGSSLSVTADNGQSARLALAVASYEPA